MEKILKYPRTQHLQGSRLQAGDEDLSQVPFSEIRGRKIVVEEKIDGANTGISFSSEGDLLLQSRGHYLTGGAREKHYNLFKEWANHHVDTLFDILGDRYILYGEWMYAKHTVFYDALPHYFFEFDIWDKQREIFLDTATRHAMLKDSPVLSVPVITERAFDKLEDLTSLIGHSRYITDHHIEALKEYCVQNPKCGPIEDRLNETDHSTKMEGIYIKIEENGETVGRLKFVRNEFVQMIVSSNETSSHWLARPIVPNLLKVPRETIYQPVIEKEYNYAE